MANIYDADAATLPTAADMDDDDDLDDDIVPPSAVSDTYNHDDNTGAAAEDDGDENLNTQVVNHTDGPGTAEEADKEGGTKLDKKAVKEKENKERKEQERLKKEEQRQRKEEEKKLKQEQKARERKEKQEKKDKAKQEKASKQKKSKSEQGDNSANQTDDSLPSSPTLDNSTTDGDRPLSGSETLDVIEPSPAAAIPLSHDDSAELDERVDDPGYATVNIKPSKKSSSRKEKKSSVKVKEKKSRKAPPHRGGTRQYKMNEQPARILLLDDTDYFLVLDKRARGQWLIDKVCDHLNLLEKDYFSLSYRDPQNVKFWIDPDKKLSKQLKPSTANEWRFSFEAKFYPPEPNQLQEDFTRYILCLQIRNDIVTGKLPTSFVTQSLLGSYTAQSEVGDYDPEDHGVGDTEYLTDLKLSNNPTEELLQKIHELHKNHKGQTPAESERNFLEYAKKVDKYGVDLHECRDCEGVPIKVAISAGGMMIYKEALRINRFAWPKILKISYKRRYFYLRVRPGEFESYEYTIGFECESHKMAKRLWRTAIEHHCFFRLKEPEPIKTSSFGFFGLGSTKLRFSTRTHHQMRSSFIDRKQPQFERLGSQRKSDKSRSLDGGFNRFNPKFDTSYGENEISFSDSGPGSGVHGGGRRPQMQAPPPHRVTAPAPHTGNNVNTSPSAIDTPGGTGGGGAGGGPLRIVASTGSQGPVRLVASEAVGPVNGVAPPTSTDGAGGGGGGEPLRLVASSHGHGARPSQNTAAGSTSAAAPRHSYVKSHNTNPSHSMSAPDGFNQQHPPPSSDLSTGGHAPPPPHHPSNVGGYATKPAVHSKPLETTTSYRTERDGKVETTVKTKIYNGGGVDHSSGDPAAAARQQHQQRGIQNEALLAEAIKQVTKMDPNLAVEKIEIKTEAATGPIEGDEATL